jgi:hypothetical protein
MMVLLADKVGQEDKVEAAEEVVDQVQGEADTIVEVQVVKVVTEEV